MGLFDVLVFCFLLFGCDGIHLAMMCDNREMV